MVLNVLLNALRLPVADKSVYQYLCLPKVVVGIAEHYNILLYATYIYQLLYMNKQEIIV